MKKIGFVLGALCAVQAVGCAAADSDVAATADSEAADDLQYVTSTNADGTWTENSLQPVFTAGTGWSGWFQGKATLTGPTGKTRSWGVCLFTVHDTHAACTTSTDCNDISIPAGGYRYCSQINGTGTKYCMTRDGTTSAYCAGTPANGGLKVSPGTYTTPQQVAQWNVPVVSYSCFEGCTLTSPSVSDYNEFYVIM